MTENKSRLDPSKHPVAMYELDDTDAAFHYRDPKGQQPRYLIEQVDGDQFGFMTSEDAHQFCAIHGLMPVSEVELARIRQRYIDQRRLR